MAVTFDVVGPSGGGGKAGSTSPQTWTHTCTAGATELLVGVSVDIGSGDGALTAAVTYNGVSMTSVLRWETGGAGQTSGFVHVFRMLNPPTGSALTVSASVSGTGTIDQLTGGSMSFAGSGSISSASHSDSAGSSVTSGSIVVPSTSASNLVAVFATNGSGFSTGANPFTAGTERFFTAGVGGAAGGALYTAGATIAGTGSNVTVSWTQQSDFYAAVGVEVQVFTGANANAVLAPGTGAALNPAIVTSNVLVGPKYAATATDLGGGQGSWATPQYAEGGP